MTQTFQSRYALMQGATIVPVMVIKHIDQAVPMAQALVAGGIKHLEVTLRTNCALDAISAIANHVPDAIVGAGTVCSEQQFLAAVDAGARFIVSPGSSDALFDASHRLNTLLLPGAVTATEVMAAQAAGFQLVKFFPAGTSGGAAAIKAFQGPFAEQRFIPTGGINADNLAEYVSLSNVHAVGGSWMLPSDAIDNNNWERVAELAQAATATASRYQPA